MSGVSFQKGIQILCIDDEADNLAIRKLLFQSVGLSVLTASSGKEGLNLFRTNLIDAVIVDYSMPDMDGGHFVV